MLEDITNKIWQYRFLEVVVGKSELARVCAFGKKYGWGEPFRVRLMGMISGAITTKREEIARELVANKLGMIPNLIFPDSPAASLLPKTKFRIKRGLKTKGMAKAATQLVRIFLPLAVLNDVVIPALTEEEQARYEQDIQRASGDAKQLTEVIASLVALVRERHGDTYEDLLGSTREGVVQELVDYVRDTADEYKYLAAKKSMKNYEEMVQEQDIVALTHAYAGGK